MREKWWWDVGEASSVARRLVLPWIPELRWTGRCACCGGRRWSFLSWIFVSWPGGLSAKSKRPYSRRHLLVIAFTTSYVRMTGYHPDTSRRFWATSQYFSWDLIDQIKHVLLKHSLWSPVMNLLWSPAILMHDLCWLHGNTFLEKTKIS